MVAGALRGKKRRAVEAVDAETSEGETDDNAERRAVQSMTAKVLTVVRKLMELKRDHNVDSAVHIIMSPFHNGNCSEERLVEFVSKENEEEDFTRRVGELWDQQRARPTNCVAKHFTMDNYIALDNLKGKLGSGVFSHSQSYRSHERPRTSLPGWGAQGRQQHAPQHPHCNNRGKPHSIASVPQLDVPTGTLECPPRIVAATLSPIAYREEDGENSPPEAEEETNALPPPPVQQSDGCCSTDCVPQRKPLAPPKIHNFRFYVPKNGCLLYTSPSPRD